MRNLGSLIIVFVALTLFCGYKFPEKLPAPTDIDTYTFERIKFGQTSVNEFLYLAPNYKEPSIEGVYTIFSEENLDKNYKSLRTGFKNQFLDWIELEFSVPLSMNKIKQTYGNPKSINQDYSSKFNYQDYGFFNVVTDKNNVSAFGITLYDESDFNLAIKQIVDKLPDYKSYNFINEFIPGKLMESDFNQNYSNFPALNQTDENSQKTYSIPKKYLKNNEYYSEVDFVFTNGILTFVNFMPKKLSRITAIQWSIDFM